MGPSAKSQIRVETRQALEAVLVLTCAENRVCLLGVSGPHGSFHGLWVKIRSPGSFLELKDDHARPTMGSCQALTALKS